jgi:hypothetical protein
MARAWCFTLNNPSGMDMDIVQKLGKEGTGVEAIIGANEVGIFGTPHIQGWVRFEERGAQMTAVRALGGRAHVEKALGSIEQNWEYCTKEAKENPQNLITAFRAEKCRDQETKSNGADKWAELLQDCKILTHEQMERKWPREYFLHAITILRLMAANQGGQSRGEVI